MCVTIAPIAYVKDACALCLPPSVLIEVVPNRSPLVRVFGAAEV